MKGHIQTCNQLKTKGANCIFQQPWWLDAVSPDTWSAIEIEKNNRLIARFPYVIRQKYGLTMLTMPKLTQTLGPWLEPSKAKYAKQLSQQKDIMNEVISRLPSHDYFCQNFHYSVTNWLPFYWQGFTQTTRYTYVLEKLDNLEQVWAGFQENIRREIRKATKKVKVKTNLDIETFLNVNSLTFQRQGKKLPYTRELVQRLDTACLKYQARQIFFAEDAQGRIHAAIYIVWDENSAYYLMGGADPELRNSGSTSLLMWEAIQFAATVTKKFDFEGSMIEPVERFFRAFGAKQVPYFQVTRMSRRMKLLMTGREMLQLFSGASI
ncbi:GNAT family N-acetyltransferase [Picosynechococcus sp. PCC 11901]|uniref:GNAT family N-acetyltransferase n=1 Tax=Picosynechococcus sp. PCC 11901 TaxID=2579791 RepID=UPI0010FBF223|nr:GNAT family N-acetyltransferase [Picosynechococcus sp. PCC 11901]QCS49049.1 GNAT family N-acetyltransferase [Picosynechococcus sp. PCC 11901]